MKQTGRLLLLSFLILSGLTLTACDNGMRGVNASSVVGGNNNNNNDGTNGGSNIPTPDTGVDLQKIQAETDEAEQALQEALQVIEDMSNDDGSINLPSGMGTASVQDEVQTQFLLDPVKQVFNRVLDAIDRVRDILDQARAKIEDVKAKLDPSNPAHQQAIAKLDELLGKLDMVEAKFGQVLSMVVERVDDLLGKIDKLKAKLDPFNPAHIILLFAIGQLESMIEDFRDELAARI